MIRVFVNAISSNSAGGHSILVAFLRAAASADDEFTYVVAVSDRKWKNEYECSRIKFIHMRYWNSAATLLIASAVRIPRLARSSNCRLLFNLADIPVRSKLPQVFFFDWPYAVYPESAAWHMCSAREYFRRRAKLWVFRRWCHYIDACVVQSTDMVTRIQKYYSLHNVNVVPSPVSMPIQPRRIESIDLPAGFKVLNLNRYYPHKNLEVLIPLAERIRNSGEQIVFLITVCASDGRGAREFLARVTKRGLDEIIVNLGTIPHNCVPQLFRSVDAMLSPTLLESYGLSYIEAMHHAKPIVTSDLPFARAVCKKAALYIDPHDPDDIFLALLRIRDDSAIRAKLACEAVKCLEAIPDERGAYREYTRLFRQVLDGQLEHS